MIRDTLSQVGGIGLYGVVSIGLFFATFLGLIIRAFRLKKPWLRNMSRLPLEPDDAPPRETDHRPEPHHRHD